MNIRTICLVSLLVSLPATPSSANVTALNVKLTDSSSVVPGVTNNDLHIDFDDGFLVQQLLVRLTSGTIFEASGGSNTAPSDTLISAIPALAYDSFVTLGGLTEETSYPTQELGTVFPHTFCLPLDGCAFNVAWAPAIVVVPSATDFVVARITLSHDAEGTAYYWGSTDASIGDPYFATGSIHNGVISFVPEPSSAMLVWAVMAAGCLAVQRKRNLY